MADEVLNQRLATLHEDVSEMKAVLKELTSAVNKLALVEQQQNQMARAQERSFAAIEKLETRISEGEKQSAKRFVEIEKRLPEMARTSAWVDRGVVATVTVLGMFVLKKMDLL